MSISKIDIIIPVYNRAHLIMDTLRSIQCQSFKDWNCFLIDDGSEDNLEEVVGEFIQIDNRFHFFKRPPDRRKGANACRNFGFEKSTSPFVYWFDSDDLLKPNALETYIHAFHPS
ncbi:MAG: glycosyltransferase family 2 protein, partial [Flavobacterium sp.]